MKNPIFLENILNNLPTALLVGALLLFLPRFIFDQNTNSLQLTTIQAGLEIAGIYIIVISLYRKSKAICKSNKNK